MFRLGRLWAAFQATENSFPEEFEESGVMARVDLEAMIADTLFERGHRRAPGGWGEPGRPGRDGVSGYAAARDVYEAVIVNYRLHPRAPHALVQYGICSVELKDLESAEGAFRQVIREYLRSDAVVEARIRLAQTLLRKYRHAHDLPDAVRHEVNQLLADAGYDQEAIARFQGQNIRPDRATPPSAALSILSIR